MSLLATGGDGWSVDLPLFVRSPAVAVASPVSRSDSGLVRALEKAADLIFKPLHDIGEPCAGVRVFAEQLIPDVLAERFSLRQ